MKEAEKRRHADPVEARKFPEKDNVHPVRSGLKGDTTNDSHKPTKKGEVATPNKRKRTLDRS